MPSKREEQESRTTPAGRAAVSGASTGERATRERGVPVEGDNVVNSRMGQFLISARPLPGFQAFAGLDLLEQNLRNDPEVQVVEVLTPRGTMGAFADGMPGLQRVVVARMREEKAARLVQQGGYQLIVERDHPLTYGYTAVPLLSLNAGGVDQAIGFTANITVLGNDTPVEGAQVCIFGSLFPTQGVTDRQGRVELNVIGESPNTIHAIYIKAKSDFWSIWIPQPTLNPEGTNVISLTALSTTLPNFPRQPLLGWGQRAMGLESVPPAFRGKGVKVAIIDSGVATTHRNIKGQVKSGYNVVAKSQEGWEEDATGHGTHCAGIICGNAENGSGIRGFAPDAEMIACKVFPGGRYSSLFDALDFCISQQVDVINLSLVAAEPSEIIEHKILQAKQLGIACIAAAGNSGGLVQYPASSPNVLAVAAIGKQGEFPPDSYHSQTVRPPLTPQGFFSPNFTCFGPQILVCAPGVAIVSSAPPDNFAAWDGTSIAASHIAGLAALVLAHHPDFQAQGLFGARSAQRVSRLFQIILQGAQPLNLGDPLRTGAGLPDATRACLPHPLPAGMPLTSFPDVSHPLQTGAPYFAGSPLGGYGMPASGGAPFPYIPFWAGGGQGPWAPTQSPESTWLLAIQQLKTAMQSAGLL
jgi:subtilisin